jgi:NAD(P)-dependent dehydrogenase (short-subunit alcohol dehydrogenase family)
MDERVAVITGGAQGIGEATARRLARDGILRQLLVDLDAVALEATVRQLRAEGADAHAHATDLSNATCCELAINAARQKFGRIDVLANCAGSTARGGILDTSEASFDRLFAVNVKAPFYMIQHAAKLMLERKSGVIVNITSMLAYGGPPFLLTYSATKAAMVTVTKSAANALKRDGIRVYAINLGWTVTPTEHKVQTQVHSMPEDWARIVGDKQPFGRLLVPDDAANLIGFLASKDAAMMTGNIIDLEQHVMGTSEAALGAL